MRVRVCVRACTVAFLCVEVSTLLLHADLHSSLTKMQCPPRLGPHLQQTNLAPAPRRRPDGLESMLTRRGPMCSLWR